MTKIISVSKSDKDANNQQIEATSPSFLALGDYPANLLTPDEVAEANRIAAELIDANVNVFLRYVFMLQPGIILVANFYLYLNQVILSR